MKKIITLVALVMLTIGGLNAKDRYYQNESPLPALAKTMLKQNFPKVGVNHVKVDKDLLGTDYEVILNDGTEVDFNSKGEWKSVDRGRIAVPDNLVIKPIRDYVAKNYKGQKVVAIEKSRNSYEVELTNGLELKFDRSGRFLRIDD